jgi:hypothetical protein
LRDGPVYRDVTSGQNHSVDTRTMAFIALVIAIVVALAVFTTVI